MECGIWTRYFEVIQESHCGVDWRCYGKVQKGRERQQGETYGDKLSIWGSLQLAITTGIDFIVVLNSVFKNSNKTPDSEKSNSKI